MADQADVYVKNVIGGDYSIHAIRYRGNGTSDLEITIPNGNEERIPLLGTDAYLEVHAPLNVDLKYLSGKVRADLDLAVSCSRTASKWRFQIIPNNLPPEIPTTVNVDIGGEPPTP